MFFQKSGEILIGELKGFSIAEIQQVLPVIISGANKAVGLRGDIGFLVAAACEGKKMCQAADDEDPEVISSESLGDMEVTVAHIAEALPDDTTSG